MKLHRALAICLASSSVASLNVGQRYDFIASDGQDIINAKLVAEDESAYSVELTATVKNLKIEKKFVLRTLDRSEKSMRSAKWRLDFGIGGILAFGRLSEFSRFAPRVGAELEYSVRGAWRVFGRIDGFNFKNAASHLSFATLSGGVGLVSSLSDRIFLVFSLGLSGVAAIGQNTRESSQKLTTGTLGSAAVGYRLRENTDIFIRGQVIYVYDRLLLILMPSVEFGMGFRW